MKKRAKLNNKNSKFVKSLSVAALAGLTFFGAQANAQGVNADDNSSLTFGEGQITGAAADINPADYLSDMYGNENGAKEKYYKFVTNDNNDYSTIEVTNSSDADFTVKYAPLDYNTGTRINDTLSTSNANNVLFSNNESYTKWGAIYNTQDSAQININADFVGNHQVTSYNDTEWIKYGAAISNYNGNIGNITGNFIDNSAEINSGSAAINNFSGNIKNITGNFIHNYVSGNTFGGAISNSTANNSYTASYIESVTDSNFIDNYCVSPKHAVGGAITLKIGTIDNITNTNFINNHVHATADVARGGAIMLGNSSNEAGIITNLQADFIGNYAISEDSEANGGAISIRNSISSIENLSGNFIGNYTKSETKNSSGGAVWNQGTIEEINAEFSNNRAIGTVNAQGGAISNTGTVNGGTITEISGNYVEGYSGAQGGAIWNVSNTFKLDEVGDITDNHAIAAVAPAYGGAIYNTAAADFGKLNGAIKNNYVLSGELDENGKVISGTGSIVYGGAIYNTAGGFTGGNVTEISGNYAESGSAPAYGGAIYNTSNAFKLDEIGDIINNHVYSPYSPAEGGAIYNENGNLGTLNGAIKDNYAISGTYDENGNLVSGAYAYGGAIYNANNGIVTGGTITEISGNYVEGNAGAYGGAIYNTTNSFKLDEVGDITDNHAIAAVAPAYGGAIYNEKGNLGEINGAIKDNYAVSMRYDSNGEPVGGYGAMGGAIYNINNGTVTGGDITEISGNYVEAYGQSNVAGYYPYARGGAIYNTSSNFKLDSISNITDNHAESTHCAYIDGGAIYNENGNLGEINGVIKNNYLINHGQQTVSDMSGGAIYNYDGTVTGGNITEISGNYITSYLAYFSCGGAIYNTSAKFKFDGIANIINNHIEQKHEGYLGGHQEGGAIYNSRGNLGTINGVIKDNYIIGSVAYGGAIYNYNGTATGGDITEISGNYIKSYGYAVGGAIYNNSSSFKLDSIGDITNNHIESVNANVGSAASGGAIYNSGGNLGVINGVIKNNYVKNETYQALGGAIYNTSGGFTGGVITEISNNYVEGTNYASGGAIYNTSSTFKLDGIGDIINNHAGAINPDYYTAVQGGAIYNSGGNLGEINGVIKNNYVLGNSGGQQGSYTYGGAIYNANNGIVTGGTITEISDNYAKGGFASGGAIYNSATFSANIIGDIVNNYTEGAIGPSGGAIYNSGTFGNIVSENISNNYAKYKYSNSQGGAIDNEGNGTIASLYVKNLTDNYIMLSDKTYGAYEYGGAIYNAGTINEGFIENVSDNYIDGRYASGGAICNTGAFNAAIGNIVNNYAKSTAAPTYGGAIYNSGTMTTLTGDNLSNNYATSETAPVYGGAIYNSGNNAKIDTISYNKIENNYASGKYNAYGGALYNTGTIENLSANSLKNNHVTEENYSTYGSNRGAYGGAIYNTGSVNGGIIGEISGNYVEGTDNAQGGAIWNAGTMNSLNISSLTNNHALDAAQNWGGAIYNVGTVNGGTINNIIGNYINGKYNGYGGAIYNTSSTFKLDAITGDITNNYIKLIYGGTASGGAIFNTSGTISEIDVHNIQGNYIDGGSGGDYYGGAIYNTGFIGSLSAENLNNNYIEVNNGGTLYGGAIYNTGRIGGGTIGEISGNYAKGASAANGGAIYNNGTFEANINGDIKNNYGLAEYNSFGGAIYNTGSMSIIDSNEISGNYVSSRYEVRGGFLHNTGSIELLSARALKNNHIKSAGSDAYGGAINNYGGRIGGGTIGEISGNYAEAQTQAYGGAIYNNSTGFKLDAINGDIRNNYAVGDYGAWGGAIYNEKGNIGDITNDYISGNYAGSKIGMAPGRGGAIYNYKGGYIGNISTKYILNNHVYSSVEALGGAIYNGYDSTIESISGSLIGNYASHTDNTATNGYGGAIYNFGTVNGGTIGDIIGNYVEAMNGHGGAIYNTSSTFKLDGITGNILNNHVTTDTPAYGGAIYNVNGNLGAISSEIIGYNYAHSGGFNRMGNPSASAAYGGAIYNGGTGTIESLNSSLINNYAIAAYMDDEGTMIRGAVAHGGAISNTDGAAVNGGTLGNIAGNYTKGYEGAQGGAIYNNSINFKIDGIKGDIVDNYAQQAETYQAEPVAGGAIYNQNGDFGDIVSNKISGNYAVGGQASGGGVIYNNNGTFGNISAKEISNNYVKGVMQVPQNSAGGGAIYNSNGTIKDITADKISNNYVDAFYTQGGGVLLNSGTVGNITANKISNNHAKATGTGPNTNGGAISNSGTAGNITTNEIKGNYVQSPTYNSNGGAISNSGTMGDVKANMIGNYVEATPTTVNPAYASGGALSNTGTMGKVTGTYKDNYVKTEDGYGIFQASFARGGAIYNSGTMDGIVNSSFLNNYTEAKDGTAQGGAIWTSKDLDITADNGTSVFKGNYTKTDGEKDDNAIYVASADAKLNLKQLNNGNMYMYDNIRGEDGYNVNISGDSTGTYYMFNDIYNGNVTMANTTINTVNNKIHTYDFKSLSVNGNTDFVADVDMANQTMDRFTASAYGNHSGKLNVKDMNFISGSDKNKIEIYFAQKGLKDYVTTSKKEFLTPLYKYGIHYDNRDDAGYFVFTRGAGSSNPSDGFNPAVLTSPVATQAGAQASMTNTLYYAFEHGDTFMNFSAMDRFAKINSNTYALAERQGALSTDFNSNLNLDYVHQNKGVWTKPYSSFESIHLKNGPKVDVISYGTLIGFDSNIHKLKRGWSNVATAYIGYNGSQVDYSNVDASTNGGLLGLTETFYKGNFWTALTATAGASFAEAHTMYGKDEMTMLMAGIGSKTGYNFEFKEGKFIIQPRLFMSYSFVNTFDYTNSAGVRIDSDPMHTVQINPSVKFIGNIKGGWQPYASVGMVWNLLNETHTEANGVKLPEMHTKPYVEYGVGLQRTWADKFSAYGQAMLRHGGRNGVALTFGFRWALGKDKTQKVQNNSKMSGRQEIKRTSLLRHSGQDDKMLKRVQHDNSNSPTEMKNVGAKKVLKQLSQTQRQKLSNTTTIGNNIYPQKAHLEHTTHTAMNANVEKL